MRRAIARLVRLSLAALIFALLNNAAEGVPPGLAKKDKIPPGFNKGKKRGWRNEHPPGWTNKAGKEEDDDESSADEDPEEVKEDPEDREESREISEKTDKHFKKRGKKKPAAGDEDEGEDKGRNQGKRKGKKK